MLRVKFDYRRGLKVETHEVTVASADVYHEMRERAGDTRVQWEFVFPEPGQGSRFAPRYHPSWMSNVRLADDDRGRDA